MALKENVAYGPVPSTVSIATIRNYWGGWGEATNMHAHAYQQMHS